VSAKAASHALYLVEHAYNKEEAADGKILESM
jgi:hypothetical protein